VNPIEYISLSGKQESALTPFRVLKINWIHISPVRQYQKISVDFSNGYDGVHHTQQEHIVAKILPSKTQKVPATSYGHWKTFGVSGKQEFWLFEFGGWSKNGWF
jgi:hypothetical protein